MLDLWEKCNDLQSRYLYNIKNFYMWFLRLSKIQRFKKQQVLSTDAFMIKVKSGDIARAFIFNNNLPQQHKISKYIFDIEICRKKNPFYYKNELFSIYLYFVFTHTPSVYLCTHCYRNINWMNAQYSGAYKNIPAKQKTGKNERLWQQTVGKSI